MRYFIAKYRTLVVEMPGTSCLHYFMCQHIVCCANKLGGLIFVYLNGFLEMCDNVYVVVLWLNSMKDILLYSLRWWRKLFGIISLMGIHSITIIVIVLVTYNINNDNNNCYYFNYNHVEHHIHSNDYNYNNYNNK